MQGIVRIAQKFADKYTLRARIFDNEDTTATVSLPVATVGEDVYTPALEDGQLVVKVDHDKMPPGVHLVVFNGSIGGVPQEWRVWVEIVAASEPADPTYGHYLTYGRKLPEAVFDAHIVDAIARVDAVIWPHEVSDSTREAYRRAVCAVVDALHDPAVVSEGSGRTSVAYAQSDVRTLARIIREHLSGTNLLYMGV